jgi:3-methylcrotonyl-CoA carboxylase alpha subunit
MDGWMIAGTRRRDLAFLHRARRLEGTLVYQRGGLHVEITNSSEPLKVRFANDGAFDVFHGERMRRARAAWSGGDFVLATDYGTFTLHLIDPFAAEYADQMSGHGLSAPMSGTVTRLVAKPGAELARGAAILVIESMKMEHMVRAPSQGTLKSLACKVGDFVQQGAELADFERTSGAP